MGIKHLKTLLEEICKNSGIYQFPSINDFLDSEKTRLYRNYIKQKNICNLVKQMRIKKLITNKPYLVGIDAYLFMFRYKRVFTKIEYGFLRQIMLSLSSKMIPIYVFDGNTPQQKKKTIVSRQLKKQKARNKLEELLFENSNIKPEDVVSLSLEDLVVHVNSVYNKLNKNNFETSKSETSEIIANITKSSGYLLYNTEDISEEYNKFVRLTKRSVTIEHYDIENFKTFLDVLKIPYITANNEADDLMALLYKKGIIQACQSDDMDMLPKGCGNMIQITKNGVSQYLLREILDELGLEHKQFVDLCILLGSDYYNTYLPKIKPFELYTKFKSLLDPCLENFVDIYSKNDPKIETYLDAYKNVRNSFLILSEDLDKDVLNYHLVPFSFEMIMNYFMKIGLRLTNSNKNQIRYMVCLVNEFIQSLTSNVIAYK